MLRKPGYIRPGSRESLTAVVVPPSPLAELASVTKSFGPTRALDRVSFQLHAGEVHALAGENGAGKSTLIRILSGVYADFSGTLLIDGQSVRFRGPADAARAGIATIHQELSLVGPMSVADNLLLAAPGSAFALPSRRQLRTLAQRVLKLVELEVDPDQPVETLPLSQRQLVEIARVLAQHARVLIMDEPTSALSEPEANLLFERILRLREQGTSIIYISHRMEEIYRVADRITVLRDGAVVTTAPASELSQEQLVAAMVGRELTAPTQAAGSATADAALSVRKLTLTDPRRHRTLLAGLSLSAQRGEILGLAGLQGSGSSELLHALFGSYGKVSAEQVLLGGTPHRITSPGHSIRRGLILLSNDRRHSVLPELSVVSNATLSSLGRFSSLGFVSRARETQAVERVTQRLELNAPSLRAEAQQLSGGNQQKVALARCLLAKPQVLLLDEPTRGIDIGAKADIYALLRELSGQGVAIGLVASELQELIDLCDRILVMYEGRIVAEYRRGDFSRERILQAAMGHESEAA